MADTSPSEQQRYTILAALAASGLATAALGQGGDAPVATPGLTRHNMVRAALAEFPGREVVAYAGLFEPGASPGPHRHPGTEFLHVIEGHGVMLREGREPVALESGMTVISEPAEPGGSFVHEVRNLSETEPMRTYVVLLLDSGASSILPVD